MNRSTGYAINPGWRPLLADFGINTSNVLRRAGLPEDLLLHTEQRVGTRDYFALWAALEAEIGDPLFPVHFAEALTAETFAPPLFAALCSPTFRVAATRISQYKPLIGPMSLVCADEPERFSISFEWPEGSPEPPQSLVAMELVFMVQLARMATRERVRPVHVSTTRPPRPAEPYEKFFGVRIRNGISHTVVLSAADAERPFLTANEAMWETFEPDLRRRLKDLDHSAAVSERVGALLLEFLPSGRTSMEAVSEKLIMSKRTLQRRLHDEGTSFQEVLKNTRRDLAEHYLVHSNLSSSEISYLLGFEDTNSFFRAFNEWTGTTPEARRREAVSK